MAYTERDASVDPKAGAALAATGKFATPLLVGPTTVLGFRPVRGLGGECLPAHIPGCHAFAEPCQVLEIRHYAHLHD
jgi:hypothetical protein